MRKIGYFTSISIAAQTFKIHCLTYLRIVFRVLRKKKKKFLISTNFFSAKQIHEIGKLRKLHIKRVETSLASVKPVKSWTRIPYYLKSNSGGHMKKDLIKVGYFLLYRISNIKLQHWFCLVLLSRKHDNRLLYTSLTNIMHKYNA